MEEKKEEQLILDDVSLDAVEHIDDCDENSTISSSKFKSTKELLKAYENLEKEFTKKCQRLSALCGDNKVKTSEKTDKNANFSENCEEKNKIDSEKDISEKDISEKNNISENSYISEKSDVGDACDTLPQQKNENWLKKLSSFLEKNENAKGYVKQITEILAKNEDLAEKDDALDVAYSMVLKDNFVTKEQLVTDEEFLEKFVYNNEKIKNRILKDYVLSLKENQSVPLIGSNAGSLSVTSPRYKPKNLTEAGLFAQHLLKK